MASQAAEELDVLKGHDFSRADKVCKIDGALAPEVKRIGFLKLVQSFPRARLFWMQGELRNRLLEKQQRLEEDQ